MFDIKKIDLEVGGKKVEISTGKYARQASSAIELRCNDTVLLITVTVSKTVRDGMDYFPLMVDYEERFYSVGKIPGGYLKREGRASDKAILVSRLIDRPVRPLFPEGYRNDVGINVTTLSVDQTAQPDTLAMLGVGFALEAAGCPTSDPVGAVRISLDADGNYIVNPSEEEALASDLDIVVAGTKDSVMMVEAGAKFVNDETVVDAIEFAQKEIAKQTEKMEEFRKLCGVEKAEFTAPEANLELRELVRKVSEANVRKAIDKCDKKTHNALIDEAKAQIKEAVAANEALSEYCDEHSDAIGAELKLFEKELLRKQISETGVRADGRKTTEVRQIEVEVGKLPKVHGDALFTRGDTQALSILALGTEKECKYLDGLDSETEKYYMHNYNFPGWSVGEVKPNRGPGRREIGHGALAERAVIASLPSREDFPYTIRVVSEVLSSSGSTSMAATCASSLALMNGGVPVSGPVAGVAMGLIKEGDKSTVLTDIHEIEDFLGDMDFKVAGNDEGISALQMDIKIKGIPMQVIRDAIKQAREGRLHILGEMTKVLAKAEDNLRPTAPQIISMTIPQDKIGAVIGSSGKNIKWIIEESGAEININDDGKVSIYAQDIEAGEYAADLVDIMANGVKEDSEWEAKIVKILDGVGAIAELIPGKSGLIHISQIAHERVEDISKFLNIDDVVKVKVIGVDTFKDRISLSIKALLEKPRKEEEAAV